MTPEQIEQLLAISSTMHILAETGEAFSGIAYDMGQTCSLLEKQLLDLIEEENRSRLDKVVDEDTYTQTLAKHPVNEYNNG